MPLSLVMRQIVDGTDRLREGRDRCGDPGLLTGWMKMDVAELAGDTGRSQSFGVMGSGNSIRSRVRVGRS